MGARPIIDHLLPDEAVIVEDGGLRNRKSLITFPNYMNHENIALSWYWAMHFHHT